MKTNTLGLVVFGIAFTGGAAAVQDSVQNTATLGDAVPVSDAPETVSEPTSTPINSIEVSPLTGCCCCEWRFTPSLNRMSDFRREVDDQLLS
jgi:hypothetical protein